ncbi:hypothetical protein AGRO_4510 [Agrobacterium sp. ATCC 31749]|nr:hypothetical protein AGRO_4510 [Agrobacterium sp. ATCC 31749]
MRWSFEEMDRTPCPILDKTPVDGIYSRLDDFLMRLRLFI